MPCDQLAKRSIDSVQLASLFSDASRVRNSLLFSDSGCLKERFFIRVDFYTRDERASVPAGFGAFFGSGFGAGTNKEFLPEQEPIIYYFLKNCWQISFRKIRENSLKYF